MEDIEYYSIPVYNFPYDEEEDDEETIVDNSELRVRSASEVPFEPRPEKPLLRPEPYALCARRFRGRHHDQRRSDPRPSVPVGNRRGG